VYLIMVSPFCLGYLRLPPAVPPAARRRQLPRLHGRYVSLRERRASERRPRRPQLAEAGGAFAAQGKRHPSRCAAKVPRPGTV
jgi:hypothetical protein